MVVVVVVAVVVVGGGKTSPNSRQAGRPDGKRASGAVERD